MNPFLIGLMVLLLGTVAAQVVGRELLFNSTVDYFDGDLTPEFIGNFSCLCSSAAPSPRPTRFPTNPPTPVPTREPTRNPTPFPTQQCLSELQFCDPSLRGSGNECCGRNFRCTQIILNDGTFPNTFACICGICLQEGQNCVYGAQCSGVCQGSLYTSSKRRNLRKEMADEEGDAAELIDKQTTQSVGPW